eukprot:06418.XXX_181109_180336_1 [CDS] Oithona nana genome sequencing.
MRILLFLIPLLAFHLASTAPQQKLPENLDVNIGTQCVFNGRAFKSGTSIKDGCNDCQCQNGLVRCKVSPLSPILQDDCLQWQGVETTTSPPNGCKFEGTYRYDGEVFTAADECNRCWCNRGEIICPFQDDCENIVAKRRSLSTN